MAAIDHNDISANLTQSAWTLGLTFLTFPAALLVLSCLSFALGLRVSNAHFVLGLILASSFLIARGLKLSLARSKIALLTGIFISTIVLSLFLAALTFDNSWDGLTYHQEYVILLFNGWNPLWEPVRTDNFFISDKWGRDAAYLKGIEILASTAYAFVGRIEAGKCFNLIMLIQSCFLSYCFFSVATARSKYSRLIACLATAAAVLNPVAITQLNTFYVDGDVGAEALTWLSSIGMLFFMPRLKSAWYALVLSTICLLNTKMYCLVFVAIGCLIASVAIYRLNGKSRSPVWRFLIFEGSASILALLLAFNPIFVSSHANHLPIVTAIDTARKLGEETQNQQQPPGLVKVAHPAQRVLLSLFSEASNDSKQQFERAAKKSKPLQLQLPFSVTARDLEVYSKWGEVRIAGFGPWFGEILAISILFAIVSTFTAMKSKTEISLEQTVLLWITVIVVAIVILSPLRWWARYVPYAWLIPIFLCAWRVCAEEDKRLLTAAATIAILIFGNCALIIIPYTVASLKWETLVRGEIQAAKQRCDNTGQNLLVFYPNWVWPVQSIKVRLQENQIPYELTEQAPPPGVRKYSLFALPLKIYHHDRL